MRVPPISHWHVSADLAPLEGGHRHQVFRTLGHAPELVFKTTDRSEAALAWLGPVLDAARRCGLVVPQQIPTPDGRWSAAGWTCETFVHGVPATEADRAQLHQSLAAFHDTTAQFAQRPGFADTKTLQTATRGGDVDLGNMPAAIVTACRAAWRAAAKGPHCVVHSDLSLGNIIRCADGRLAVIDWDEARRDDAMFDRAVVQPATAKEARAVLAWEVACCWIQEPVRARRLARDLIEGDGAS